MSCFVDKNHVIQKGKKRKSELIYELNVFLMGNAKDLRNSLDDPFHFLVIQLRKR